MTAAGKITTARIQTGDRVLVKHYTRDNEADAGTLDYLGKDWALGISTTKTGQGVEVARVLKVEAATVTGGRRDKRVYDVYTTAGIISNCAPAQTWTLAPEDNAGVKRAHVEALALNEVMDAYPVAEDETETPAEEPAPIVIQYAEPRGLAATATILDGVPAPMTQVTPRQAGKSTQLHEWTERMVQAGAEPAPVVPEIQAATAVQEPMRHRYHGKTLGQRRSRRKAERLARRANRR